MAFESRFCGEPMTGKELAKAVRERISQLSEPIAVVLPEEVPKLRWVADLLAEQDGSWAVIAHPLFLARLRDHLEMAKPTSTVMMIDHGLLRVLSSTSDLTDEPTAFLLLPEEIVTDSRVAIAMKSRRVSGVVIISAEVLEKNPWDGVIEEWGGKIPAIAILRKFDANARSRFASVGDVDPGEAAHPPPLAILVFEEDLEAMAAFRAEVDDLINFLEREDPKVMAFCEVLRLYGQFRNLPQEHPLREYGSEIFELHEPNDLLEQQLLLLQAFLMDDFSKFEMTPSLNPFPPDAWNDAEKALGKVNRLLDLFDSFLGTRTRGVLRILHHFAACGQRTLVVARYDSEYSSLRRIVTRHNADGADPRLSVTFATDEELRIGACDEADILIHFDGAIDADLIRKRATAVPAATIAFVVAHGHAGSSIHEGWISPTETTRGGA
jgi:hypothetical protein